VIIIGLDPLLATIGPITLRWYSLMLGLGVAVAVLISLRQAKLIRVSNVHVYWLVVLGIFFGVITGRLVSVIDRSAYHLGSLRALLVFDLNGVDPVAALIGGVSAGLVYCRIRRIPIAQVAGASVPALILGQATGLLGGIISGDDGGSATVLPWGIVYTHPAAGVASHLLGVAVHPIAGYRILIFLGVLAFTQYAHLAPLKKYATYLCALGATYLASTCLQPVDGISGVKVASMVCSLLIVIIGLTLVIQPAGRMTRVRQNSG
jgi:prolipoprotein diacylglyceryltransferase